MKKWCLGSVQSLGPSFQLQHSFSISNYFLKHTLPNQHHHNLQNSLHLPTYHFSSQSDLLFKNKKPTTKTKKPFFRCELFLPLFTELRYPFCMLFFSAYNKFRHLKLSPNWLWINRAGLAYQMFYCKYFLHSSNSSMVPCCTI